MLGFFRKTRKQPGWLAIGLDADAVRVAQLTASGEGKPKAGKWGTLAPASAGEDFSLAKAIDQGNLPQSDCTTLLLPSEYQILAVESPNVPREELRAAIRWRIKDLLEWHVDDATIDVLEIPLDVNAEGKARSMYAVAASNEVIRKRISAFEESRLELKVIDIPEMAQRNISALYEERGRATAVLSFRPWGGLLTFTSEGELLLTRRLEVSSDQLAMPEHRTHYFERVVAELRRSLEGIERKFHQAPVGQLLLAPLPPEIELAAYLAEHLYVPVKTISLPDIIDFPPESAISEKEQGELFHLFGAALRVEPAAL